MKVALIVEGTSDADQIYRAFSNESYRDLVKCVITEGTKVNNRILTEIGNYIKDGYSTYILSDPDSAGDSLAHMVNNYFPEIERIDVDPKQCAYFTGKRMKAGIEYSSYKYLKKIICPLLGVEYKYDESPICWD